MKLLIDTNIVLDYLLEREDYEAATELFRLAENNEEYECLTASAVTDILYILTRELIRRDREQEKTHKTRREILKEATHDLEEILSLFHILPVSESEIKEAFLLKWKDFEDAVQYLTGRRFGVDVIITRNGKDFKKSEIPAMAPREFLNQRLPKENS